MSDPLSVIILTYNEEDNLPACLESLKGLDCEIFVVDSGSTDRTCEIASKYGAKVVEHAFQTHAQQWKWALDALSVPTEWILALDADQRLTSELETELRRLFTVENFRLAVVDGFYVKRRQVFQGRWIRHGGYYPKYLLKLFRANKVRVNPHDLVDHHFHVGGRLGKLRHDIIEENKKEEDISFWVEKHVRYAALLALEEIERRRGKRTGIIEPALIGGPDQRVLFLKELWFRLPLYVRPFLYFMYRYFVRLGFLDGKEGLLFHFLQGLWFRFLVDAKIYEYQRKLRNEGKTG